jgi:DNA-binding transcriptional regulator LsrR (DeoR family)
MANHLAGALAEHGAYEQEERAWALRRQGHTVDYIAKDLGVSRPTANRRLRAARDRVIAETSGHVEEWRAEHLTIADDVIATSNAIRAAAVKVDPDTGEAKVDVDAVLKANASILRALDTKAKLLGTYSAEKVDVSATVTHVDAKDAELATMLDHLAPAEVKS